MSASSNTQTKLTYKQAGNSTALFVVVALLAIIIGIYVQGRMSDSATGVDSTIASTSTAELPKFEKTVILPTPRAIKTIAFTDHNGQAFGLERFKNQWSIVFFGFTNCPDICPSTLRILKDVKQQVSDAGHWDQYQVVMVSVDPERDTPEKLGAYVPFFDAEFIGITADVYATQEFAKSVGALFIKRENEQNDEWYDVDHSASLILINPQGEWAGAITAPHNTQQITNDLVMLADYHGASKNDRGESRSHQIAEPLTVTASSSTVLANQAVLQIQKAWIRPAPANARSAAAYFKIRNSSEHDITIVDSESPDFEMTMIHDTEFEDGLARMNHLDELVIPAGTEVELKPLGLHMMLMQPKASFDLGSIKQITLISDEGQRFTTDIEVRDQPQ